MTLNKNVKALTRSPQVKAFVVSDDGRRELENIFSSFNSSRTFFSCQAKITLLLYKTAVGENLLRFD
jgi:hypothetical protein